MPSKMNRTTHKVIEGICIPQVWQFAVPDEWDNDDIVIRNGELFYKDEKQDVPMKFEEVDIFSLAEQKQSDWDGDNVDGETEAEKISRLGARPTSYSS